MASIWRAPRAPAFDQKRPTVAILDLQMPGIDGAELTRLIRSRDLEVPILIMTASGGPREWQHLATLGANRFFVKPIVVDDVVAVVRQFVKLRSTTRPTIPE